MWHSDVSDSYFWSFRNLTAARLVLRRLAPTFYRCVHVEINTRWIGWVNWKWIKVGRVVWINPKCRKLKQLWLKNGVPN